MSRRDTVLKYFDKYKNFMDTVVEAGIEKNRKGNAYLEIVDTDGHPISGAEVTACQKNHNFKYGANIFMLDELESDEKNSAYRDAFKDVFNLATLPFYWSDLEPVQGKPRYAKGSPKIYRRPAPDLCAVVFSQTVYSLLNSIINPPSIFSEKRRGFSEFDLNMS